MLRIALVLLLASCAQPPTLSDRPLDAVFVADLAKSEQSGVALGVEVALLDVGQGDCSVIRLPNGASMVVDCGSSGGLTVTAAQIRNKIQTVTGNSNGIDVLVLSHSDKDHYNLVTDVFSASSGFSVGTVYIVGQASDYSINGTTSWLNAQQTYSMQVNYAQPTPYFLMQGGGASVTVIAADVGSTPNDKSAVLVVNHGGFEALLAGDATDTTNTFLQHNQSPVLQFGVEVFKIEHHGANTYGSNSAWFVEALDPDVSVASCAKHLGFGHPRLNVVQECELYSMTVPPHPLETYDPVNGWQQWNITTAVYSTYSNDDFVVWTDATGANFAFNTGSI